LRPDQVTAVVLGQDPYPRSSRATGRSFEQGDLPRWKRTPSDVAESLRRILQVVAYSRTGRNLYLEGDGAWGTLVDDIDAQLIDIAQPREFFDRWQAQGILCLNAGLTLSRFAPEVQRAHFDLWRPVVQAIFKRLVTRQDHSIVFLLWGAVAFETFSSLGILDIAKKAGTEDRVAVVRHSHPGAETSGGAPRFFQPPNTFAVANEQLVSAGGQPLHW
jgi:uracil-DNA glycosylase